MHNSLFVISFFIVLYIFILHSFAFHFLYLSVFDRKGTTKNWNRQAIPAKLYPVGRSCAPRGTVGCGQPR